MFDPAGRPVAHFVPRRNWMNDPNGLIWHDGEYHLFFQHNPEGIDWGNMSWGHAVSSDLASWTELPVALRYRDEEHFFSGCAVYDATNSSGLGTDEQPPLVAVYTASDPRDGLQRQALAFSLDRGRTWETYVGNPVLDIGSTDFRDPKVFRHGDSWIMVVVLADKRVVRLYGSTDLIEWRHLSDAGPFGATDGVWECPDLILVPHEGDDDASSWVLLVSVASGHPAGGSGMQYAVGDFDGVTFVPTGGPRWLDLGADCYAAVSYADAPTAEPIIQGWMSNWTYAAAIPAVDYRGSMTLPRRLALRRVGSDLVLVQRPVLGELPEATLEITDHPLSGRLELPGSFPTARIQLLVDPGAASAILVEVRAGDDRRTAVRVDIREGTIALDRSRSGDAVAESFPGIHSAPRAATGPVELDVVVDVASVEVFADDGAVALTDLVFPGPSDDRIAVIAEGGECTIRSLIVRSLVEPQESAR